jgi:hypothetical protein
MLKKQPIGNNHSADERDITFMVNLFGVHASTTPVAGWRGVALHSNVRRKMRSTSRLSTSSSCTHLCSLVVTSTALRFVFVATWTSCCG